MTRTGTVAFGEYRTWFRVEGDMASGVPPSSCCTVALEPPTTTCWP